MRSPTPVTLTAAICLILAAVFSWWAGSPALADETQPAAEPAGDEQPAEPADNSGCYVCHTDYEGEPLAQVHFEENVGCIDCHGESQDHADDEDHATAPDTMFSPDGIAGACSECHKTHDAPAAEVIKRWQERCPKKEDPAQLVCTDCHGKHRLEKRKVRWDKRSGKLIEGEQ
jgi:hypothetical protein